MKDASEMLSFSFFHFSFFTSNTYLDNVKFENNSCCHFEQSEKSLVFKHLRYYVFTCCLSLIVFCCYLRIHEISRFARNDNQRSVL